MNGEIEGERMFKVRIVKAREEGRVAVGVMAVAGLAAFLYTAIRAFRLALTHDEALSFFFMVRQDSGTVLPFFVPSANNHLLNSFLMTVSARCFGEGEFALRLPNVLAHGVYLVFGALLARRCGAVWLQVCTFLVLCLNPFILDYFSLARGYGLGLAFLAMSLYGLYRYLEELPGGRHGWAIWGAFFAVLSNFSLLHYYLALVAVMVAARAVHDLKSGGAGRGWTAWLKDQFTAHFPLWRNMVLLSALIVPFLMNGTLLRDFYYGGTQGFWADTVGSLIRGSLYENTRLFPLIPALGFGVIVLWVLCLAAGGLRLVKEPGGSVWTGPFPLAVLMGLAGLCTVLQHEIMGSKYLLERTALFLVPPFVLMTALGVRGWAETSPAARRAAGMLFGALALLAVLNMATSVNGRYVLYCKDNADIRRMLEDLRARHAAGGGGGKIRLGIDWAFEPSINYYLVSRRMTWLEPVNRSGIGGDYDYYYWGWQVAREEDERIMGGRRVESVAQYPLSRTRLDKRVGE